VLKPFALAPRSGERERGKGRGAVLGFAALPFHHNKSATILIGHRFWITVRAAQRRMSSCSVFQSLAPLPNPLPALRGEGI